MAQAAGGLETAVVPITESLELYEQPIVELSGGAVVRHELLIRMSRDGAVLQPASFLGEAERRGLAGEIDRWVVGEAVRRARSGRAVNVNVSAQSVGEEFAEFIRGELAESAVDPGMIVFELDEPELLEDGRRGFALVRGLAELGCGVALDDFGSGYGAFAHLRGVPLHYLKIDAALVRDLGKVPANRHLIEWIVVLARSFRLETVAEGVEDLATLQILADAGIDCAQGFALGEPAAPLSERTAA